MLSDDKKRSLYDQFGEAGVKSGVGAPSNAYVVPIFPCSFIDVYCCHSSFGNSSMATVARPRNNWIIDIIKYFYAENARLLFSGNALPFRYLDSDNAWS